MLNQVVILKDGSTGYAKVLESRAGHGKRRAIPIGRVRRARTTLSNIRFRIWEIDVTILARKPGFRSYRLDVGEYTLDDMRFKSVEHMRKHLEESWLSRYEYRIDEIRQTGVVTTSGNVETRELYSCPRPKF